MSKKATPKIYNFIKSAENIIGLPLCFHDMLNESGLPLEYRTHSTHACRFYKYKENHERECINFDVKEVRKKIIVNPEGMILKCPFGFWQIAVPVFKYEAFVGVLFAGPCFLQNKKNVKIDQAFKIPVSTYNLSELKKRQVVLSALALKLGNILKGKVRPKKKNRSEIINNYIMENYEREICLNEIAKLINISESRCSHLIKEIFGCSLPNLVNFIRLKAAAELLQTTDFNITEVSRFSGFTDSNYFTKLFKKQFSVTPSQYRKNTNNVFKNLTVFHQDKCLP